MWDSLLLLLWNLLSTRKNRASIQVDIKEFEYRLFGTLNIASRSNLVAPGRRPTSSGHSSVEDRKSIARGFEVQRPQAGVRLL